MTTDESLYRRVLAGDGGALEALVHRYHSPLLGFLYRYTGDRHLAQDLVQETFTRLITHTGSIPNRFKAWAFTIATNLARDHFRSAYHRREQVNHLLASGAEEWDADRPDHAAAADELLLRDDERRSVFDALQMLSPSHREVLILRFYHDMALDEIAKITKAPIGTVKSRLFHALKHLKAHLAAEGGMGRVQPQARLGFWPNR